MLATTLASLGHHTTWFTSTFNHYSKTRRKPGLQRLSHTLTLEVLPSPGYTRNISVARLLHNRMFARAFEKYANAVSELPDIIAVDLPTTDAAAAAARFGNKRGIPVVVTIRDLWPDFFEEFLPNGMRNIARLGIAMLDRQARFACRNATSIVGVSEKYLNWGLAKADRPLAALDRVVPLGYTLPRIPSSEDADAILASLNIPRHKRLISFVGSWGKTYDLSLVFEAARLLAKRDDIVFVVAGAAKERPQIAQKLRSLSNTRVIGWIDSGVVAALLSRSEIGLLPYVQGAPQGVPNKIYEYMAFGPFQIATLGDEAGRLYDETATGLNVSGDPTSIAACIEDVLSNTEIMQNRAKRMEVFHQRFDATKVYHAATDHLVEVVERYKSI
ncbi:glycosyltransferase [Nitratireductor aquibiodomus]|uniref:glycosyltransferase n=1 Tax=Nitratireductor aquibiodomus TaxID=204799 RepID=UPI001FEFB6E3|nr:glycosyltransferase [Nitratireductor aquibiodomus]